MKSIAVIGAGISGDRIGVAAETRLLFEELRPVPPAQEIGSGQVLFNEPWSEPARGRRAVAATESAA